MNQLNFSLSNNYVVLLLLHRIKLIGFDFQDTMIPYLSSMACGASKESQVNNSSYSSPIETTKPHELTKSIFTRALTAFDIDRRLDIGVELILSVPHQISLYEALKDLLTAVKVS